jgi:hypothetical protein
MSILCSYIRIQEYLYHISNLCEAVCNLKYYFRLLDTVLGYHIYDFSSCYTLISSNKYANWQRQVVSLLPVCFFFIDCTMYVLYVHVVVLSSLHFAFMEREIAMDMDRSTP